LNLRPPAPEADSKPY